MPKNTKLKETNEQKALKVIQALTTLYEDGKQSHKDAENMLCNIYKYSHIAIGSCKNPHKDWIKELNDMYKALKKDYI